LQNFLEVKIIATEEKLLSGYKEINTNLVSKIKIQLGAIFSPIGKNVTVVPVLNQLSTTPLRRVVE
jgi:hypothetical protein